MIQSSLRAEEWLIDTFAVELKNENKHNFSPYASECYHRYYTNNTGLEAPFAGSIVLYIPKTTLPVVSRTTVAAGGRARKSVYSVSSLLTVAKAR